MNYFVNLNLFPSSPQGIQRRLNLLRRWIPYGDDELLVNKKIHLFKFFAFISFIFLSGCATTPPSNPENICDIFDDKPAWYKGAKKSREKWGSGIPTIMAFMYQESQFVQKAKPARTKILWIFPGPRPSDAYGFAQVKSDTWDDYKRDAGGIWVKRDDFDDAADFIGWYNNQSNQRNKIKLNDPYNLYLAYHEGQGGYAKKTYNGKAWLKSAARQVAVRSENYTKQLKTCEDQFNRSWWWPF